MSTDAFSARAAASEGKWFNKEQRLALARRVERMVELVRRFHSRVSFVFV